MSGNNSELESGSLLSHGALRTWLTVLFYEYGERHIFPETIHHDNSHEIVTEFSNWLTHDRSVDVEAKDAERLLLAFCTSGTRLDYLLAEEEVRLYLCQLVEDYQMLVEIADLLESIEMDESLQSFVERYFRHTINNFVRHKVSRLQNGGSEIRDVSSWRQADPGEYDQFILDVGGWLAREIKENDYLRDELDKLIIQAASNLSLDRDQLLSSELLKVILLPIIRRLVDNFQETLE